MAIGTPVGSAFLEVQPQIGAGFQAAIAGKINPVMAGVAGVAGGILAGGLAAGFAAFKIGETFDEAFDTIRVGTGAVGDELAGLQEDFKGVFAAVPTDAGLASQAITELNQRLGLTGGDLQGLSAQFLELSRITETDLGSNIENVTRVFGDWGISLDDQKERLDQLFRANQETGISVDSLAGSMVKFGAPLRQLGFSFDQSAALISKFEQEGVNAELVLGSMRIALGKMARAGEPAQETFQRVVESIQSAGSASEANALALELFGARAGPDMAAAIREGRFEVNALMQSIGFGTDTIETAGAQTQDFAEKWNMFKNRVLVALEPIATRVFSGIGSLIDVIAPKVESFITGTLVPAIESFSAWWDVNGPKIMAVAGALFNGLTLGFQTIVGVIQSVVGAFQENEGKISGVMTNVQGIISGAVDIITNIVDRFRAFWAMFGDEIVALAQNAFRTIGGIITAVVQVIKGVIDIIAGVLTGDWKRVWEGVKNIVGGVWDAIKTLISGAVGQVMVFIGDFVRDAQDSVRTGLAKVVTFFKELPGKAMDALKAFPGMMIQLGKDLIGGIISGLGDIGSTLFNKLKDGIGNAIDNVQAFFGIKSPSTVVAKMIGVPLGQGVVVGFEEGLDPGSLLGTTRRAVDAISAAASPAMAGSFTGTHESLTVAGSAPSPAAPPTTVNLYLDPQSVEHFAQFVVDWERRIIRQTVRAGG